MSLDKYEYHRLFLNFRDKDIETLYRKKTVAQTLVFSRICWLIVIVLGGFFASLDKISFGDKASQVLIFRLLLLIFSAFMILLSFSKKIQDHMDLSGAFFVSSVGLFSIYLTTHGDPESFNLYVCGVIMAFSGVFIQTGIGFRYNFYALIIGIVMMDIALGIIAPISKLNFIVYNFFIPTVAGIIGFASYLVEKVSRDNFVTSIKLEESLDQVKVLSGFLPICSNCKKIRDDEGYWDQVETYISKHSDAEFTHSLCPSCSDMLIDDVDAQITQNLDKDALS